MAPGRRSVQQRHARSGGGELQGVLQEVREDLPEALAVDKDDRRQVAGIDAV